MSFVAPPGYQPIYNPSIPYLGPIHGGLRPGSSIYIQGSISRDTTRFLVNLLCGEYEGSDIALHFNPRFDGRDKVVFNSCQGGSWASEEKTRDMPFTLGKPFELVIMVTSHGYEFKVNGREFHKFQHRIPMERVRGLQISGDVIIQTVTIGGGGGGMGGGGIGGGVCVYPEGGGNMGGGYPGGNMGGGYPGMGGGCVPGPNLPSMTGQPLYNPPVPFSERIPDGMSSKKTIIIRGMVPYGANRMSVNLVVSRTKEIAFHMNPRVREGVVVRNSMISNSWGAEERETSMNPFAEGQYFDMSIRCGNQRFKVFVNGQHMFDFPHRYQPFTMVDLLEITGDVQISYILF